MMKRRYGCSLMLLLPIALLGWWQGPEAYRNLIGVCGATGKRLSDQEFVLKAIEEARSHRTDVQLSPSDVKFDKNRQFNNLDKDKYQYFYKENPNCCQIRRGYDENRLIKEGVNWELGEPMILDRLGGSGYVRVKIDPRPLGVKEPFWDREINYVNVYLDTCGRGGDEGAVRRMIEG